MDIKSLLEQKNNVFDHIFYEFNMYDNSFSKLFSIAICDETKMPDKQFWMNVLLETVFHVPVINYASFIHQAYSLIKEW